MQIFMRLKFQTDVTEIIRNTFHSASLSKICKDRRRLKAFLSEVDTGSREENA